MRAQRRHPDPPDPGRNALEALRRRVPETAAETRLVHVPANRPPWTDAGLRVWAGDELTTFATGRVHFSRLLDLWAGPHNQLWFRPGAGPIFRGTRDTHTFKARGDGPLELASQPPGVWTDNSGALRAAPRDHRRVSGGIDVLVLRWRRGAASAAVLRELAADDPAGFAAAELDRRATVVRERRDWHHLWHVGASEIYRETDHAVECDTHADVGIVKQEVDFPLTDTTRLRWEWRVDELPSELAEDTFPTHDYLSIALEFDNGHDLTWHWSAELPPGWSYSCPIPTWRDRETHMVVRSGREGLGRWLHEERAVRRDYAAAVGLPPKRIVGVWLIGVSLFQRGRGRCAYRGIELRDGDRVERL
jgi:DUF3047 family protein